MLTNSKAIVLRTIRFGESSMAVDLLTASHGRLSFAVRIPKTAKARVKKQFFQPMTLLDVSYDYRPRKSLQHLSDARLAAPLLGLASHPAKVAVSLFVAEFLYYCTRGEQQDAVMFQYIESSMLWLDAAGYGFANFHLVFMMRLSRFLGFYPNLDDAGQDCFFDLRNAVFTPAAPPHPDYLVPAEAAHISTLMRLSYATMHLFRMSHSQRNRVTDAIVDYYRLHIPQMPALQSLPVLRALFAD